MLQPRWSGYGAIGSAQGGLAVMRMQSTVESLERYLARLPDDLAGSPMAAAAMRLAEGLDNGRNSLTSQAMASKAFQDLLAELRTLGPVEKAEDELDELSNRRGRRRHRGA